MFDTFALTIALSAQLQSYCKPFYHSGLTFLGDDCGFTNLTNVTNNNPAQPFYTNLEGIREIFTKTGPIIKYQQQYK